MKRRYTVLFLSLVLALALAVPALGGPNNPIASISASVKQTATKALNKAKAAQKTANSAQSTANSALSAAGKAQSTADAAQKAASAAQSTANTAQSAANAAQKTADEAKALADTKLGSTFSEFGTFEGPYTTTGFALEECPGASEVTGGGYEAKGTGDDEILPYYTAAYGDAWFAGLNRIPGGTGSWEVRAIVTCAE